MLANFLNKSKPINFIGILVFFIICFIITVSSSFLSNGFSTNKLLQNFNLLLLFLSVFFFYNFILNKNRLTFDNSYAYFLFTLLIICILPELTTYKILISDTIYFFFLRKLYSLRSSKKVIQKLFDSGFWLGILFILEPISMLFFILVFSAIILNLKITLHTLLTAIIGFITPLFIYFTYFFWFDKTEEFTKLFNFNTNFDVHFYTQTKFIWFFVCIVICSLLSIIFKSAETLGVSNTFRRSWTLLIINFLIVFLYLPFLPAKNGSEIIFILFPVSVIIANGIELINNKIIQNLILYSFLIGSIFFCFFL
ncbi:hypothetical protein SAMN05216503_3150 [Polaribacter sp. KT25b]|uniref:DUF6427 family protein n=1 Tax=Polaribacter sp. KT25b TaxID=1855336 RepID=UPI00087BA569|nr:DUF6427 family protein [Polaribacter sp. KT25b]SDS46620.1 hypothetical protein SAMN05216503_3150 [Polaribacter sp. KT25b]